MNVPLTWQQHLLRRWLLTLFWIGRLQHKQLKTDETYGRDKGTKTVKPLPKFSADNTHTRDVQEIKFESCWDSHNHFYPYFLSYEAGYASICHCSWRIPLFPLSLSPAPENWWERRSGMMLGFFYIEKIVERGLNDAKLEYRSHSP